jgi:hypothetical protein
MTFEGQANAGGMRRVSDEGKVTYDPAPMTEYPRMMYRKTEVEERVQQTDDAAKCGETFITVNNYGSPKEPLLCDTRIAHTATEAEELTGEGWDITPRAAHGLSDGLAKVTTAKDDEIARLRAELEAAKSEPKRGPGRPPKSDSDAA